MTVGKEDTRHILYSKMKSARESSPKAGGIQCVCPQTAHFSVRRGCVCQLILAMESLKEASIFPIHGPLSEGTHDTMKPKQHSSCSDLLWRWFFLYLFIFFRNIHLERKKNALFFYHKGGKPLKAHLCSSQCGLI